MRSAEMKRTLWIYTTSTSAPQVALCDDCGEEVDVDGYRDDGDPHCDGCGSVNVTFSDLHCAGCGRASVEWKEPAGGGGPRHPFCLSCGWCAHYQWDERDMRKAEELAKAREGWVPEAALREACTMLAGSWDCPWGHCEDESVPCLKGRPADGPGCCLMTDEDVAECWFLHLAQGGTAGYGGPDGGPASPDDNDDDDAGRDAGAPGNGDDHGDGEEEST